MGVERRRARRASLSVVVDEVVCPPIAHAPEIAGTVQPVVVFFFCSLLCILVLAPVLFSNYAKITLERSNADGARP